MIIVSLILVLRVCGAKHGHVDGADGDVMKGWYRSLVRLGGRRKGLGVWWECKGRGE